MKYKRKSVLERRKVIIDNLRGDIYDDKTIL